MNQMTDQEKLRFLLSHWISHNGEHAAEYRGWADRFETTGPAGTVTELKAAIEGMDTVNGHLLKALEVLGGPVDQTDDGHNHGHRRRSVF